MGCGIVGIVQKNQKRALSPFVTVPTTAGTDASCESALKPREPREANFRKALDEKVDRARESSSPGRHPDPRSIDPLGWTIQTGSHRNAHTKRRAPTWNDAAIRTRRLLKTARRNDQSAIRHDDVRYHLHPRCALRPRPRRRLRRARRRARACRPRAPRPGRPRREEGCVRRPAPQLFQPFCCCRPPRRSRPGARARCGRGIRRTPVAWVRPSRDARSSRVSRRDPRASLATPASAPSPPSPRASPPSSCKRNVFPTNI